MENISKRIANLAISQTIAMAQKSRDMKQQGIDVINLSVGEPDFNTPQHIKDAAKKAIDDNYSTYPPVNGYLDLRQVISKKLKNENNLSYSADQIVVSNGAKHALANILLSTINKGDEVIILAPYWVTYVELVKLAEGTGIIINCTLENDFKATAEKIEQAITPKTKAIMLCSPSNPTGSVYSKTELESIAKVIAKHPQIIVISDEIYEHINFVGKHESIAQFDFIKDQVAIINGVSKAYAMTGWRIGYSATPVWLAKACNKLQGQFTSSPSSIAQRAALAALEASNDCVVEMKTAFDRRRKLVIELINNIEGLKCTKPEGAFYLFPDISSFFGKSYKNYQINNSNDLCMYLLKEAKVATVPGEAFGSSDCIRLSYATSDEVLKEACQRIKTTLKNLKK